MGDYDGVGWLRKQKKKTKTDPRHSQKKIVQSHVLVRDLVNTFENMLRRLRKANVFVLCLALSSG